MQGGPLKESGCMLKSSLFSMAIALILLLSAPIEAVADIYSWVDANGVRHFSNTNTDSSDDQVTSAPEFSLPAQEAERIQREAAEKAASEKGLNAIEPQPGKAAGEKRPMPVQDAGPQADPEKAQAEALAARQARCKKAKERLSTLRFTSFHKYEHPEVERYALEWDRRHLQNEPAAEKTDWRKARDEDVEKYKRFKYEQELRQAEQEVDESCRN